MKCKMHCMYLFVFVVIWLLTDWVLFRACLYCNCYARLRMWGPACPLLPCLSLFWLFQFVLKLKFILIFINAHKRGLNVNVCPVSFGESLNIPDLLHVAVTLHAKTESLKEFCFTWQMSLWVYCWFLGKRCIPAYLSVPPFSILPLLSLSSNREQMRGQRCHL